ncbi:MAG: hypothetical protein H0X51_02340 [Parachlamydiaceae bacterium]|nr:hypothetical protein [Parachlamydiaceae bacterium]
MVSGLGPTTPGENQKITFDNKSNFVMPDGEKRAVKVIVDNEQWDAGSSKPLPENVTRTINELIDKNGAKIKDWDKCTITVYSSEHRLVLETGNQKYGDIFDKASRRDLDKPSSPPPTQLRRPPPPTAPRPEHLKSQVFKEREELKSKTEESAKEQERPTTPVGGQKRPGTPPSPKSQKKEESPIEILPSWRERAATTLGLGGEKTVPRSAESPTEQLESQLKGVKPTVYSQKDVEALVKKHEKGQFQLSTKEFDELEKRKDLVNSKNIQVLRQSKDLVESFDRNLFTLPSKDREGAIKKHLQAYQELQKAHVQLDNEQTILFFKEVLATGEMGDTPELVDADKITKQLVALRKDAILKMSSESKEDV